ncbi:hypothetical protein VTI28DRAFT_8562 [Corynascus sepedonium]
MAVAPTASTIRVLLSVASVMELTRLALFSVVRSVPALIRPPPSRVLARVLELVVCDMTLLEPRTRTVLATPRP